MGILNQKNLWPRLIYQFEHSGTPYCSLLSLWKSKDILTRLRFFLISRAMHIKRDPTRILILCCKSNMCYEYWYDVINPRCIFSIFMRFGLSDGKGIWVPAINSVASVVEFKGAELIVIYFRRYDLGWVSSMGKHLQYINWKLRFYKKATKN